MNSFIKQYFTDDDISTFPPWMAKKIASMGESFENADNHQELKLGIQAGELKKRLNEMNELPAWGKEILSKIYERWYYYLECGNYTQAQRYIGRKNELLAYVNRGPKKSFDSVIWITALSESVCEKCLERDCKIFSLSSYHQLHKHPHCHCSTMPLGPFIPATVSISEDRERLTVFLDQFQMVLDVLGLIPGYGEIFDGINAIIYLGRGDYENALLSTGSMIPIVGSGFTVGKFAGKGAKILKKTELVEKAAEEVINVKTEIHHIATNKSKKFDFKNHSAFKEIGININKDIDNLVNLANHRGRHTNTYNLEVQRRLDAVYERFGGTDKLESAIRSELQNMKQEILDGKLNPYGK